MLPFDVSTGFIFQRAENYLIHCNTQHSNAYHSLSPDFTFQYKQILLPLLNSLIIISRTGGSLILYNNTDQNIKYLSVVASSLLIPFTDLHFH